MNISQAGETTPLINQAPDLECGSESFLSVLQTRKTLESSLRGRKVDELHIASDCLYRAASLSLCLGLCIGTAAYTFWKISHNDDEQTTDTVVVAAIIGAVCLMPSLFTGLGAVLHCRGDENVAARCSLLEQNIQQLKDYDDPSSPLSADDFCRVFGNLTRKEFHKLSVEQLNEIQRVNRSLINYLFEENLLKPQQSQYLKSSLTKTMPISVDS